METDYKNAIVEYDKIEKDYEPSQNLYYYRSLCYNQIGDVDKAVAALRISLEKGFRAFAHIENDDDMDAIRNRPDFIALIAEYKAMQTEE